MCHPDRSEAEWRDLLFQLFPPDINLKMFIAANSRPRTLECHREGRAAGLFAENLTFRHQSAARFRQSLSLLESFTISVVAMRKVSAM
jgi:hypothetical protein